MKGHIYFLLSILLVAIAVIYFSLQITGARAEFLARARFLPLAIGIALAIATVALLFVELRKKATEEGPAKETTAAPTKVEQFAGVTAAWLAGAVLLIVLIGFPLGTFLFVGAYLKLHNMGWIKSIAIGLGLAIIIYIGFDFLLGVDLYQGVLYIPLYRFLP